MTAKQIKKAVKKAAKSKKEKKKHHPPDSATITKQNLLTITAFRYNYVTDIKYHSLVISLYQIREWLQVEMYDLGFKPTPRGQVVGDFTIVHKNNKHPTIEVGKAHFSDGSISINPEIMAPLNEQEWDYKIEYGTKVKGILIVESKSMFDFLLNFEFHTKHNVIVVALSGYPDQAARAFVNRLVKISEESGSCVHVFGATDCNQDGFRILSLFEETLGFRLKWVGAYPSDIRDVMDEPHVKSNAQKLSKRNQTMLKRSVKEKFIDNNDFRKDQIEILKKMKRKYEFEVLEAIRPGMAIKLLTKYMGIQDRVQRIQDGIQEKKRKRDDSSEETEKKNRKHTHKSSEETACETETETEYEP
jgi:hypothetical protein